MMEPMRTYEDPDQEIRHRHDAVGEPQRRTSDQSYMDEKKEFHPQNTVTTSDEALGGAEEVHGITPGDPFPIDPNQPEEEYQLTVRSIVVGCILGCIVGASNIYLGLKTGFTFGPQLFGAIFGYAILKPLSRMFTGSFLPGWLWGGPFGPKENCTVQSAATSSGGIGILFVTAIPAMYRLGLLSELPSQDTGKLIALTISSALFGVFFVIPLRKYYILRQKLVFPTPTATAFTIRSLHTTGVAGAAAARKKILALGSTFIAAFCFKVANGYIPGVLLDWHIGWTLYRLGWTSIISLENYGWFIEFTPAFYGAGMLSGLNASWSFFGGAVLAWGIISPSLIATGKAVGISISDDFPLMSYQSLSSKDPVHTPSPRYWLLWPGVLMMLTYSLSDLAFSSTSIISGMRNAVSGIRHDWNRWRNRNNVEYEAEVLDDGDPAPPEDRVPTWAWVIGLTISIIMSCSLVSTQFHMNVGEVILALVLGFIFSFIGVQSSGDTDINPVSTVAKASQLIFGGVAKGNHTPIDQAQRLNLIGGVLAAGSAAQASDMTGDLKTGHLLRAKPKNQFVAQIVGSIVSVFLNVGLFILFTKASPCILYPPEDGLCTYSAPSVAAWAAVARAVTLPSLPIPSSSGYTAIALSIFGVGLVALKHLYIPKNKWHWVPNWNAVGLAFVVPQTYYPIAMVFGATINYYWEKRSPKSFDMYGFPIAAGLLAGEGLGGVFQAILTVAGVGPDKYGLSVGCPGLEFCG